jgi:hypothetical protein
MDLEKDQFVNMVLIGKTLDEVLFVLIDPFDDITRYANI